MRTEHDFGRMEEVGFCTGIENYSMHIDGRSYGDPPFTLLDYFPDDFLCVIDESHVAVPQLHGQYAGDRRRKETLIANKWRKPGFIPTKNLSKYFDVQPFYSVNNQK